MYTKVWIKHELFYLWNGNTPRLHSGHWGSCLVFTASYPVFPQFAVHCDCPVLSHSIQKRRGHSEWRPTKVMMMPQRLRGLLPGELQNLLGHGPGILLYLGPELPVSAIPRFSDTVKYMNLDEIPSRLIFEKWCRNLGWILGKMLRRKGGKHKMLYCFNNIGLDVLSHLCQSAQLLKHNVNQKMKKKW